MTAQRQEQGSPLRNQSNALEVEMNVNNNLVQAQTNWCSLSTFIDKIFLRTGRHCRYFGSSETNRTFTHFIRYPISVLPGPLLSRKFWEATAKTGLRRVSLLLK